MFDLFINTNEELSELILTYKEDIEGDVEVKCEFRTYNYFPNYNYRLSRFEQLVKLFHSNHYDKNLIINYLHHLKVKHHSEEAGNFTGLMNTKFNRNFDMLDLLENKLQKCSNIFGGQANHGRTTGASKQQNKYRDVAHTKGKYAGYTKCYISSLLLPDLYLVAGKDSYNIVLEYDNISLSDMIGCKEDRLFSLTNPTKPKRYVIPMTKAYCVIYETSMYFDVTHKTLKDLNFKSCSNCGEYHKELDHKGICIHCRESGVIYEIESYSHKPRAEFIRLVNGRLKSYSYENAKFNKYYYAGQELEVELKSGVSNEYRKVIADEIMNIKTSNGTSIFYCKFDSSLDSGFEIVSHPMTFNAWRSFDFSGLISKYRTYIKSFNTRTAGMHLHISRNAFTDFQAYKILRMTYDFPKFSMLISERDTNSQNSWASLSKSQLRDMTEIISYTKKEKINNTSYDFESNKLMNKISKAIGGHRGAWNFRNSATAECRLFKGQLDPTKFYKNLEYVEALIDFTKNISLNHLCIKQFVGFVKSNWSEFPNLNRYLAKNKTPLQLALQNPKEIPDGLNV